MSELHEILGVEDGVHRARRLEAPTHDLAEIHRIIRESRTRHGPGTDADLAHLREMIALGPEVIPPLILRGMRLALRSHDYERRRREYEAARAAHDEEHHET